MIVDEVDRDQFVVNQKLLPLSLSLLTVPEGSALAARLADAARGPLPVRQVCAGFGVQG